MKHFKTAIKLIMGLVIGMAAGLLIAAVMLALFTDTTFSEFFIKLSELNIADGLLAVAVGAASLVISIILLIPIHEGGHLIGGLISGYRFISFRIFQFTFIKLDGKIRIKRYSIAGTMGQCLMEPPEKPISEIPVTVYNAGGVAANVVMLLIAIPLLLIDMPAFVKEFLVIFIFTDAFIILLNGIPMQANGIGNDGHNALTLRSNSTAKRSLVIQLKTNAKIQEGIRPKDMPDEWFEITGDIDPANSLEIALPMLRASRLLDEGREEDAYAAFCDLYKSKDAIMQLYVREIECELIFLSLITGRKEEASAMISDSVMNYIEKYRKIMSSKDRAYCAIKLYLDDDAAAAHETYEKLKAGQQSYLLQGEVKSDLALIERYLPEIVSDQSPI